MKINSISCSKGWVWSISWCFLFLVGKQINKQANMGFAWRYLGVSHSRSCELGAGMAWLWICPVPSPETASVHTFLMGQQIPVNYLSCVIDQTKLLMFA